MKIKNLIILVLLGTVTSCNYLDVVPEKVGTIEYAFRDKLSAENYLATCYSYLPYLGSESSSIGRSCGTEVTTYYRNRENGVKITLEGNSVSSPKLAQWDNMYKAIRACNTFLENVHLIRDLNGSELNRWIAEVKFLKAYYHWILIQHYGPIILQKENLSMDASSEAVLQFRSPINECIDYVIQLLNEAVYGEAVEDPDLDIVEPPLPLIPDDAFQTGRITLPIAAAMRAKIMVHVASPFFAENTMYENFIDSRGVKLFPACSEEERKKRWADAAKACKEAVDICHQAGHQLFDYNPDLTIVPNISEEMRLILQTSTIITEEENNKEIIWADPKNSTNNVQTYAMPAITLPIRARNPRAQLTPTLATAENFYTENGVPIEEDKDWDENGWYENRYMTTTVPEKDYLEMEPGMTVPNLHMHRESRFYGSMGFNGGKWLGLGSQGTAPSGECIENYQYTLHCLSTPDDLASNPAGRSGEQYYSVTGYFTKKLINYKTTLNTAQTGWSISGYQWPNMRLADLYLLYAEALNETMDQPTADIWENWIDPIRKRAGLEGVADSWTKYSTKPDKFRTKNGLRDIIHQERCIELALEGHYYYDMRRWSGGSRVDRYDIMQEMNKPIKGWNCDGADNASYYTVRTIYNVSFSLRDYLWPIKEGDINVNPNLVQNPGY